MTSPASDLATLLGSTAQAISAEGAVLYKVEAKGAALSLQPLKATGPRTGALADTPLHCTINTAQFKEPSQAVHLSAGDPRLGKMAEPARKVLEACGGLLLVPLRKDGQAQLAIGFTGASANGAARQGSAATSLLEIALSRNQGSVPLANTGEYTVEQLLTERDRERQIQAEFLAGLGHELKTPLNAIIGFSSLLEKQLNDEELLEEVEMISLSAEKLLTLIDDLIDSYKIQAGKLSLHKDVYNINEIIANSVEQIRVIADERGIRVRAYLDNTVPDFPLDSKRIQQVMVNLLGNAVKFVPAGGEIIVRSNCEPTGVRVQVADTGEGIPPEVLPSIFERFKQAEGSERRDARSAGLGLALCKDFVEMHGGKISVTSERNKGSIFTFTLPFKQEGE